MARVLSSSFAGTGSCTRSSHVHLTNHKCPNGVACKQVGLITRKNLFKPLKFNSVTFLLHMKDDIKGSGNIIVEYATKDLPHLMINLIKSGISQRHSYIVQTRTGSPYFFNRESGDVGHESVKWRSSIEQSVVPTFFFRNVS